MILNENKFKYQPTSQKGTSSASVQAGYQAVVYYEVSG